MRTLIILGMHRSATSMVSKSIHDSGNVFMGDEFIDPYHEDKKFVQLNDEILAMAGGNVYNPPPEESIKKVSKFFDKRIERLVKEQMMKAEKAGYYTWGFKDPRTVLTIDLYMPHLDNPQFVCNFRNPHDIALSLYKRDRLPIERGMLVAKIYNDRLQSFIKKWLNKLYV